MLPSMRSATALSTSPGSVTNRLSVRTIRPVAVELPPCGVAMKITRLTNGKGRTKRARSRSSRVSGLTYMSARGRRLIVSQIRVPGSITVILASSPPWLCPITTI